SDIHYAANCMGFPPNPDSNTSASRGYFMSGQTACQQGGYYSQTQTKTQTLTTIADCGSTGNDTPPSSTPFFGDAITGPSFGTWVVPVQDGFWSDDNRTCFVAPETDPQISISIETCSGSICCGTNAQNKCSSLGGSFGSCTCVPVPPECTDNGQECSQDADCCSNYCTPVQDEPWFCSDGSPILIDFDNDGANFRLTDPAQGVLFDLNG